MHGNTRYQVTAYKLRAVLMTASLGVLAGLIVTSCAAPAHAADPSAPYRNTLVREAQAVFGPNAPVPMFAGQIRQESSWRANVTAPDLGRGLAQFMDGTTKQIATMFPELGPADPYDPRWSMRALIRFDGWLYARVKGDTPCEKWGAALKGYNAGLGWSQRAQKASATPGQWFGATEYVNPGQSAKNFEYSRLYPRWILWKHQPLYRDLGRVTCEGTKA
jgi:soluble lytic murein transglycosylase-like protein